MSVDKKHKLNPNKYVLVLDAGTTSVRAILYNHDGKVCSMAQKETMQFYPEPGWVEQDPEELLSALLGVIMEALTRIKATADNIASIGVANQRETTIVWDKNTGEPVYNAIVWQCRRTADIADDLIARGLDDKIRSKTGLRPDAYFSATKIKWILDNVEGAREKAENGDLLFGTVDTWIVYNITAGNVHITDYSNASRTMLFNINTLEWDDDILKELDIPRSMLPEVKASSEVYGYLEYDQIAGSSKVPIASVIGDQQASLFGQHCFDEGDAKITYGTGCFILMNTSERIVSSDNGLVTTIAWGLDGKVTYSLEGSIFVAGAAIQWLRDSMHLIDDSFDSEYLATKSPDSGGCYVVPAFTGLGAPHWDQYARGTIVGITRGTTKSHIIRATLESIAYQVLDVARAMKEDSGLEFTHIRVDGGASNNDFLMQFQSDMLEQVVARPTNVEATAMGAAYLAGLAVGFWKDMDELRSLKGDATKFSPAMEPDKRTKLYKGWNKAVKYAYGWAKDEE